MSNATVTGLVINVEHVGMTTLGNPMQLVTLSTPTVGYPGNATFRISNNASLNYTIGNAEYRDVPHVFALTRSGRISNVIGPFSEEGN